MSDDISPSSSRSISESSEDENNYVPTNNHSPTLDLSINELLNSICEFSGKLFYSNLYKTYGHNVTYSLIGYDKTIHIDSISFEINRITYTGITIIDKSDRYSSDRYKVILNCRSGLIEDYGDTVKDAMTNSLEHLKKIVRCNTCKTAQDKTVSEYCICCLFSDYYTKNNPTITCIICTEKTRDFVTMECGHIFHYNCLLKVVNQKCPICRAPLILPPV